MPVTPHFSPLPPLFCLLSAALDTASPFLLPFHLILLLQFFLLAEFSVCVCVRVCCRPQWPWVSATPVPSPRAKESC